MKSYSVTRTNSKGEKTTYASLKVAASKTGISRFIIRRLASSGAYHTDGSRFECVHNPGQRTDWDVLSVAFEPVVYAALSKIAQKRKTSRRELVRSIVLDWLAKQPGVVVEQATVVEG